MGGEGERERMRERERGFGEKEGVGWGRLGLLWAQEGGRKGAAGPAGVGPRRGREKKRERKREREKRKKRERKHFRNPILLHECICTFKAIKRNARFGMVHQTT